MSGWDILRALERDPLLHAIPVIICSAAEQDLHAHRARLTERSIHWLEKPFEIDVLHATIVAAVEERRRDQFHHRLLP